MVICSKDWKPAPRFACVLTDMPLSCFPSTDPSERVSVMGRPALAPISANILPSPAAPAKGWAVDDDMRDAYDSDDDSIIGTPITEDCNAIRRKINKLINSGEMKVTHFQRACKITPRRYGMFMKAKGPYGGSGSNTYEAAFRFFERRRRQGIKEPTTKKVNKTKEAEKLDTAGVTLDGELDGSVPIYDTCDEMRRKINAYLRDPNVTKVAFNKGLRNCLPEGTNLQSKVVNDFLAKKGALAGNNSATYYASYVFFEKQRLAQNKPKSKHREECEKQWPGGVTRERQRDRLWLHDSEGWTEDQWGKMEIFRKW